jgi:hypothetical protein
MGKFVRGDPRINRKGRPRRGKSLTDFLEKALKQKRTEGGKNNEALAKTLIELAIKDRNITAIRYIFDRIDGKPTENIEFSDAVVDVRLKEILNGNHDR